MFDYSPVTTSPAAAAAAASPWTDGIALRSDDADDDVPRFENVIDDRREVREARLIDGFHDIDPRRKEQVCTTQYSVV